MRGTAPADLLDLSHTAHPKLFENIEHAWQALPQIQDYLRFRLKPGIQGEVCGEPFIGDDVFIGEGTVIEHGAMIKGPAWIGRDCEIRNGCYIRGNVIVGDGVVLGNSCEFKNCVVFDEAEVPHFNYAGDSIIGYKGHLGAGVILSNVRLDRQNIRVEEHDTGLRKFGAIIGDHAEIGCNAVLNPGSVIGRNSLLYPGVQWQGTLPANRIVKLRQEIQVVERR